ncbi:unnamed protein product [Ostreobium quekettii]|uniref:Ester cyclase n=1 Tax=Ostreobium quekettii TaxID=121088 RepID=A0A8S1J071_9CHLO|nr:unnamed protein product [Ostreobium quekettii]|eukprot:evm.model.scf_1270.2 EVM.evm.TU.scf_1270.2   scf_1270:25976-26940(+)
MPVVALRDSEEIEDWRVRQMVDVCGLYFGELWSRGNLAVADDICDAAFVHTDSIWNPSRLVAGPSAMKAFVRDTRAAYPDLVVRAVEYGTSDADRLFVHWTGSMTNLGRFHGHSATRQNTKVTGVSMMSFTKDRSKLVEVNVFRQPTREEKTEFADREGGFELHLARLHFG